MRLFWIRLRALLFKELAQAFRDPRLRFLIVGPPVLQLLAFGYAANLDIRNIPMALYDEDRSPVSRDLVFAFSSSGYFSFREIINSPEQMEEAIDHNRVDAVLHFAPILAARVDSGRTAEAQIIVSGTNSNTASLVQAYSSQIVERFNRAKLKERLERNPTLKRILPAGAEGIIRVQPRVWYNTSLKSRNFYVPGIIAMVIMLTTLNLTSMAVVREKEVGTMEQIMVTPIRPVEFILGKTIPFALIGLLQTSLISTVGVFWFEVPMRGSIILLFVSVMIYLLSCLSIGLLISTVSRTQQQALVTTFFFFFPAILLSGFMFPIANMPPSIQWVTYFNPLRYFLVMIRSIFLKGAGLEVLWPQMIPLLALGLAFMTLAVKRVGKTID